MKTQIAAIVTVLIILVGCGSIVGAADAPPASRPNVLFIICDDLNLSEGCYGNSVVKTPNIDALAARGERFERAYCQYPLCLPSRNSFLSGRRPYGPFNKMSPLRGNLNDPTLVFLPEQFRNNGYFTGRVGKLFHVESVLRHNPVEEMDDAACWDLSEIGGTPIDPDGYSVLFAFYPRSLPAHPELQKYIVQHDLLNKAGGPGYDYWMERIELNCPDDLTTDGYISKRISEILEQRAADKKPFFLAAGFRRPHNLWAVQKKYYDLYDPAKIKLPVEPEGYLENVPKLAMTRGAPNMTDDQRRIAIASYYSCVSATDEHVGEVIATLDRLKLADNTIIVLTSDHGWHLDEHGLWGKVTLWQEGSRVPCIIIAPHVTTPGSVCTHPVEMIDYYPTLCELCGVPIPPKIDGISLVPQLKDPQLAPPRPAFTVVERAGVWGKAVNTEQYRYTEWDDGKRGVELYDLKADPKEFKNLANDRGEADEIAKLKTILHDGLANVPFELPATKPASND